MMGSSAGSRKLAPIADSRCIRQANCVVGLLVGFGRGRIVVWFWCGVLPRSAQQLVVDRRRNDDCDLTATVIAFAYKLIQ